ncbi:hypothetical protein A2U01_0093502, partial [Trifolium medium]|nr:hypothetical protein [Trifolium medium]
CRQATGELARRDLVSISRQFSPVTLKLTDFVSPGAHPAKVGDKN